MTEIQTADNIYPSKKSSCFIVLYTCICIVNIKTYLYPKIIYKTCYKLTYNSCLELVVVLGLGVEQAMVSLYYPVWFDPSSTNRDKFNDIQFYSCCLWTNFCNCSMTLHDKMIKAGSGEAGQELQCFFSLKTAVMVLLILTIVYRNSNAVRSAKAFLKPVFHRAKWSVLFYVLIRIYSNYFR